jgi:hypothetical protein
MIKSLFSLVLPGFIVGCSIIPDFSAQNSEKEKASETSSQTKECSEAECPKSSAPAIEPTYGTLGLAGHCTYNKKDAEGCFTCTPRDLPRTVCTKIDENFDPSKGCENDTDLMTCKVRAEGESFEFDFSEQTQIERIYSKVPFFLLGAKVYIGGKLEDNPVARDLIFASFDSIIKFKKDFFTTSDISGFFAEFEVHLKKAKPDIDTAKLAEIRKAIEGSLAVFAESYSDGKVEDKDFLNFAYKFVQALPPELGGSLIGELNIDEIMKSLDESGSENVIEELLNNAGSAQ